MLRRQHLYFESGSELLFGWLHQNETGRSAATTAVICNPLGVEYMSGHRSIRRLADQLAEHGIATLRFDYSCTGDSSGGEFRNTSIAQIVADIDSAAEQARELTGCPEVVLIGIGLGATFAALASESRERGRLVLWNPTVSGKRFVREQKLLAAMLEENEVNDEGAIDSAGVYLTTEMQRQLGDVNLGKLNWNRERPLLLIDRSDTNVLKRLASSIVEKDFDLTHVALPGYSGMMDQPTDTVVPVDAFNYICEWLGEPDATTHDAPVDTGPARATIHSDDVADANLVEVAAHFGEQQHLFGISSCRADEAAATRGKTAHVLINCGSEHHAGPHRIYTILSRRIAAGGGFAFRFDLEGIGDSVSLGNNEENNSYSPVAMRDVAAALDYLAAEYGCSSFVLSGICAGAYHSFKAMTDLKQHNIREANLINPLVFEYNYDDPDDHLKYEVHTYRVAIRQARNWRRFFTGDIDYRRLFRSVPRHIGESLRRQIYRVTHALSRSTPKGLPGDLRTLRDLGRPFSLLLSDGDPGYDIMKLQAGWETRVALAQGDVTIHRLQNANHGLSKKHMQDQLIATLLARYFPDSAEGALTDTAQRSSQA